MNKYWKYNDRTTLYILAPLVSLFALGLDFYIPIVPQLRYTYTTSQETMQLTLSGFMFVCAISQIIVGPICDKYGRKKTAITSLFIFIIGSIIAPYNEQFSFMLLGRILQAAGSSGTFLCAYTTVRDLYPNPSTSTKIYSYINMCISQSPIFAPLMGGFIAQTTNWQMVFVALTLIGITTLVSTHLFYIETMPKKHTIHYQHLKTAYRDVITNRNFQVYSLAAATGMGSFFMFFSQSPYIIMEILGYSKPIYGIFFGVVGMSFFIASLYTSYLTKRYSIHTTVSLGAILMLLGGTLLVLSQLLFNITIAGFILPMMIVVAGAAYTIGAGLAGTMQPFGSIAGIAFSAIGFVKFAFSALLGIGLMQLNISPLSLGQLIMLLSGISALSCFAYRTELRTNDSSPLIAELC